MRRRPLTHNARWPEVGKTDISAPAVRLLTPGKAASSSRAALRGCMSSPILTSRAAMSLLWASVRFRNNPAMNKWWALKRPVRQCLRQRGDLPSLALRHHIGLNVRASCRALTAFSIALPDTCDVGCDRGEFDSEILQQQVLLQSLDFAGSLVGDGVAGPGQITQLADVFRWGPDSSAAGRAHRAGRARPHPRNRFSVRAGFLPPACTR